MSLEIEVLDQIQTEAWPVNDIIGYIEIKGGDGWQIIENHWRDKNIQLVDENKIEFKEHISANLFRNHESNYSVFIVCTEKGLSLKN